MFIYLLVLFNNWTPFKDALSGLRQFLPNESPLIRMKNAFYFTLKILFVLKIFKFLTSIKNGFIGKIKLVLKFMTSQPGKQTIARYIAQYLKN